MQKRLVLAITLSMAVLLGWQVLFVKPQPAANKLVTARVDQQFVSAPKDIQSALPIAKPSTPPLLTNITTDNLELVFNDNQGAITEAIFKAFKGNNKLILKNGIFYGEPGSGYLKTGFISQDKIVFEQKDAKKRVLKSFSFSNSGYNIELEVQVENLSNSPLVLRSPLVLGSLDFAANAEDSRFQDVTFVNVDKIVHSNGLSNKSYGQTKFLGLRNRYFCAILEPLSNEKYSAWSKKIDAKVAEVGLILQEEKELGPGEKRIEKFRIYLGPQDLQQIDQINPEWGAVVHYGTFDIIAQVFVNILRFIHKFVHNWGLAIIIFTILLQIVLYPFTLMQMRSMREMQVLQPQIEALKAQFKDNPQKLNKEIMQLYKTNKVNPLGGCLPMILQMPIFLALYQVQYRLVFLKDAQFLWIKDLAQPDKLSISANLPSINLLPILAIGIMFVQQKLTTPKVSGEGAQQQKIMSIMMVVMMALFLYNASSGFNLYMFVNMLIMFIQALLIWKKK